MKYGHLAAAAAAMAMVDGGIGEALAEEKARMRIDREREIERRRAPLRWIWYETPLNRSRHWPPAATYLQARDRSPFPSRPVR